MTWVFELMTMGALAAVQGVDGELVQCLVVGGGGR